MVRMQSIVTLLLLVFCHGLSAQESATYSGRVLFEGQPVEGAEVTLYEIDGIVVKSVSTGMDGSFTFIQPRDNNRRAYEIIVRHPEYSIGCSVIDMMTKREDINITIYKPAAITGIVRSTNGEPLPNVELSVGAYYDRERSILGEYHVRLPELSVQTDTDGRYRLEGMPMGVEVIFSAMKPGFRGGSVRPLIDSSLLEYNIYLEPASTISGKVTNSETREPVSSIGVSARPMSGQMGTINVAAGNDGSYIFPSLKPDLYRITVSPGQENLGFCARPLESVFAPRYGTTDNVDIELIRGVIISGTVTDKQTGEPIPDCPVIAYIPFDENESGFREFLSGETKNTPIFDLNHSFSTGNAITDDQGRFEVTALPGHVFVQFLAMDGYHHIEREDAIQYRFISEDGSYEEVHLRLTKDITITGTVYLPDGSPAEGIRIGYSPNSYFAATTDSSGWFTYTRIALDPDYENILTAEDSTRHLEGYVILDPYSNDPIEIHLRPYQYTSITGRVIDHLGNPVKGKTISLHRHTGMLDTEREEAAYSGADGTFMVDSLRVGQYYALRIIGEKKSSDLFLAGEDEDPIELVIPLTNRWVDGRVVDEDGIPIIGAKVQLSDDNSVTQPTETDETGRFRIEDINTESRQSRQISISHPEKGNDIYYDILTNTSHELVMRPHGRHLGGQVVGRNGTPLPDARIRIYALPNGQRASGTYTDASGRFIVTDLTGNTVRVIVDREGYRPLIQECATNRDDIRLVMEENP